MWSFKIFFAFNDSDRCIDHKVLETVRKFKTWLFRKNLAKLSLKYGRVWKFNVFAINDAV